MRNAHSGEERRNLRDFGAHAMILLALTHCARETSPSIVVHNVAGAAARLENYEGAFSASFRASYSLPVTLVGTNNDLEKLKKALSPRLYTRRDQLSAALSSQFEMTRRKKKNNATKYRPQNYRNNITKSNNIFMKWVNRIYV